MKLNTYGIYDLPTKRAVEQLQRKITSMEAEIQSARSLINSIKANGTGGVMPDLSEYAKTSEVEELLVPYAKSVDVESALESYALTENVASALAGKVNVVNGKGLSTNDYTTEEKTKLAGIEDGAQKNPAVYNATLDLVDKNGTAWSTVNFHRFGDIVTVNMCRNELGGTSRFAFTASTTIVSGIPDVFRAGTKPYVPLSTIFHDTAGGWGTALVFIQSNVMLLWTCLSQGNIALNSGNFSFLAISGSYKV